MARGSTWTNSDGLIVGFGTHSEDNGVATVHVGANGVVTLSKEITLSGLADTPTIANSTTPQDVTIPRGSVIKSALLQVITAPVSGGGGTLDIGTIGTNGTEDDFDGIVADATVAEMGLAGEGILLDGVTIADAATAASTVASVGAVADADCYVVASYETAVFTAGVVKLVVEYIPPSGSAGRTIAA